MSRNLQIIVDKIEDAENIEDVKKILLMIVDSLDSTSEENLDGFEWEEVGDSD